MISPIQVLQFLQMIFFVDIWKHSLFQDYFVRITFPFAEDGPTFSYDELSTDLYLFDWNNGEFHLELSDSPSTHYDLIVKGNITNLQVPIPSAFSFIIIGVALFFGLRRNKAKGVS